MSRRLAQALLAAFFIALLATPVVLRRLASQREAAAAATGADEALARYGLHLEEVARASGVNFIHQSPTLDPQLDPITPMISSLGAAVSVVDYDRDGWQDLYVTNSAEGASNALYRNLGDGTFRDVAAELGVGHVNSQATGVSMGAVWGDYDNDGYEDLFLYRWGRPQLFHNQAGSGFSPAAEGSFPAWVNANTAIWFDYDRDGYLDLFLGGYYSEEIDLWELATTRIMPESFEYAQNGGRNYLFRNRGDGSFGEVSERLGPDSRRWTLAAVAADLRGTGFPDLFVANEYGIDELFLNQGGERFIRAEKESRVGFAPKSGMNAAFGDVTNEGSLAIYVSNISEPGVLLQCQIDLVARALHRGPWVHVHIGRQDPEHVGQADAR